MRVADLPGSAGALLVRQLLLDPADRRKPPPTRGKSVTVIGTCAWNLEEVAAAHSAGGSAAVRDLLARPGSPG